MQPSTDKTSRMYVQTPKLEAGSLYLPKSAPWLDDLMTEYLAFPKRVGTTIKLMHCHNFSNGAEIAISQYLSAIGDLTKPQCRQSTSFFIGSVECKSAL